MRISRFSLRPAANSRRGSVLVMVIAILVLMALIGTAYVSVARIDRQAAATGSANTKMDLLTSAVAQQVDAFILNGVFGTPTGQTRALYRPVTDNTGAVLGTPGIQSTDPTAIYHDYDSQFDDRDGWLASRVPEPMNPSNTVTVDTAAATANPSGNPPVWPSVSFLQSSAMGAIGGGYKVDAPYNVTTTNATDKTQPTLTLGGNTVAVAGLTKGNLRFEPTFATIGASPTPYPAMKIFTVDSTLAPTSALSTAGLPTTVLAADADGDGIADSLYFRLSTQPDPGITYYAGVRIIDNNSAINASTAWSVYNDYDGDTGGAPLPNLTANPGTFASNVGLQEMLGDYNLSVAGDSPQMDVLNRYRFNWSGMPAAPSLNTKASAATVWNDPWPGSSPTFTPAASAIAQFDTYGDMLEMQVARRLDNPGYNNLANTNTVVRFQSLSWSDQAALADRFCLASTNPASTLETLWNVSGETGENLLLYGTNPASAGAPQAVLTQAYTADEVFATSFTNGKRYWYNDNFNYDSEGNTGGRGGAGGWQAANYFLPRRAVIVTRSPVSDNVPWDANSNIGWNAQIGNPGSTVAFQFDPTTGQTYAPPSRANLNTSGFTDLYNAFLACMLQCDNPAQTPFCSENMTSIGLANQIDLQKLRAAISAANTISMRSSNYLTATGAAAGVKTTTGSPQRVTVASTSAGATTAFVYGVTPQPFITEVVVNDIAGGTPKQYVAIKLYNPTATDMNLTGSQWQLVAMSGSGLTTLFTFDASAQVGGNDAKIPAGSYLWVASGTSAPVAAIGGKAEANGDSAHALNVPGSSQIVQAPNLINGIGQMILLVRPLAGEASIASLDALHMAPVDQVDLTHTGGAPADEARVFYYARAQQGWGCVYPGSSPGLPTPNGTMNTNSTPFTTQGSWRISLIPEPGGELDDDQAASDYNGVIDALNSAIVWDLNATASVSSNFVIPLGFDAVSSPGPNPITGAPYKYPYGAFARDGDAFKVFFIGAYCIADTNGTTLATVNGVSYDSAYSEDHDKVGLQTGADDGPNVTGGSELLGQFCPLGDPTQQGTANAAAEMDFDPTTNSQYHHYYFARFLLDYVGAINTPNADFMPNLDSTVVSAAQCVANNPSLSAPPSVNPTSETASSLHGTWANRGTYKPVGGGGTQSYNNEYDQPNNEGLININTAPWRVLAMLPMVSDNTGSFSSGAAQGENILLAKAIVAYRDKYGPFTSIFDLNRVFDPNSGAPSASATGVTTQGFYNGWGTLGSMGPNNSSQLIGPNQLDFTSIAANASPGFPRAAGTPTSYNYYSAKDRLNMITRISNLVTTRSDSFTVYIVVEGWKNAGTANAQRVSQVRQAYIADRSQVNGLNKTLNIIPVPTN